VDAVTTVTLREICTQSGTSERRGRSVLAEYGRPSGLWKDRAEHLKSWDKASPAFLLRFRQLLIE